MLLNYQTVYYGVKISAYSISECVKSLINQGVAFVLTHSFQPGSRTFNSQAIAP